MQAKPKKVPFFSTTLKSRDESDSVSRESSCWSLHCALQQQERTKEQVCFFIFSTTSGHFHITFSQASTESIHDHVRQGQKNRLKIIKKKNLKRAFVIRGKKVNWPGKKSLRRYIHKRQFSEAASFMECTLYTSENPGVPELILATLLQAYGVVHNHIGETTASRNWGASLLLKAVVKADTSRDRKGVKLCFISKVSLFKGKKGSH